MGHEMLFLGLLGASSAHADASRREFAKLELTEGQPKILFTLRRANGIVQKELAEVCKVRQSTLTVLLTKLEKQGYIYKDSCYVSGKKHAYRICLTEAGWKKADELEKVVEDLEEQGFTGFSEEERRLLLELLTRVEQNMRS